MPSTPSSSQAHLGSVPSSRLRLRTVHEGCDWDKTKVVLLEVDGDSSDLGRRVVPGDGGGIGKEVKDSSFMGFGEDVNADSSGVLLKFDVLKLSRLTLIL